METLLLIKSGTRAGERLTIDQELELGRDVEGDGRFADDGMLSRRHARVTRAADGTLIVSDLGSGNGTFVNGSRVTEARELAQGDVLELGETRLEVRDPTSASSLPAPVEQVGAQSVVRSVSTSSATAPRASVLFEGALLEIPATGLTIGRQPDNHLVVKSTDASRHHAQIAVIDGRHCVIDLRSANGTYLNGERLVDEARWLNSGDTIVVGGDPLRYVESLESRVAVSPTPEQPAGQERTRNQFRDGRLRVGRDVDNDVCLDAPTISRFHAEVVSLNGAFELTDLGSRNGTRLDGRFVGRELLRLGSEIGIGPFRLIFDGEGFHQRDERGALRLDAYELSMSIKERTILDRASLSIQPGELVTVIGESGSGKSTLMRLLVGAARPSHGVVLVNGEPLESRLADIGYLPQDEIVHPRLTVLESLRYSARLRLPADSSPTEIEAAVARVLAETSLEQQANTRIGTVSGGQRKRVGLATELLSRPGLLFLDEPTTGLDPALETRMMELFERLASVGTQALLVVTHATRNLELADRLCVLARGGYLCFSGKPEQAKDFFDVKSFDDIYLALDRRPAEEWRREFEIGERRPTAPPPFETEDASRRRLAHQPRSFGYQGRVLSARYLRVFLRDRRNVLLLVLQAPLLGLVMALLFKPEVFAPVGQGIASSAAQLIFLLVVTTIWLGTISSAREIIKERPVFERERAVGVGVGAYMASKLSVLFPLVALQACLLMAVVVVVRPLHEAAGTHVALLGTLVLTGFAAVSMGLLISAAMRTEEQAMALIPIAMIVQLLFGGALVTVQAMGSVMAVFSTTIFSRWAFAGAGATVHMNDRIEGDKTFRDISQYGESFFDVSPPETYVILLLFTALFTGASILVLRRPRP